MIRFIDLTKDYWVGEENQTPLCAFLNTTSNTFLLNMDGQHVFHSIDEVKEMKEWERLLSLMPTHFFDKCEITNDVIAERIGELRQVVERAIPSFAEAVSYVRKTNDPETRLMVSQSSFGEEYDMSHYVMLGMAVTYATLENIQVLVSK